MRRLLLLDCDETLWRYDSVLRLWSHCALSTYVAQAQEACALKPASCCALFCCNPYQRAINKSIKQLKDKLKRAALNQDWSTQNGSIDNPSDISTALLKLLNPFLYALRRKKRFPGLRVNLPRYIDYLANEKILQGLMMELHELKKEGLLMTCLRPSRRYYVDSLYSDFQLQSVDYICSIKTPCVISAKCFAAHQADYVFEMLLWHRMKQNNVELDYQHSPSVPSKEKIERFSFTPHFIDTLQKPFCIVHHTNIQDRLRQARHNDTQVIISTMGKWQASLVQRFLRQTHSFEATPRHPTLSGVLMHYNRHEFKRIRKKNNQALLNKLECILIDSELHMQNNVSITVIDNSLKERVQHQIKSTRGVRLRFVHPKEKPCLNSERKFNTLDTMRTPLMSPAHHTNSTNTQPQLRY